MPWIEIGWIALILLIFFVWFGGMFIAGLIVARFIASDLTDDEFWQMMEDAAKEPQPYWHPWDMM